MQLFLSCQDLSGAKFGEINLSKDAGDLDKSVDRLMLYCTETEIKTLASLPADHKASASEKLYFLFCTVQTCSCTW